MALAVRAQARAAPVATAAARSRRRAVAVSARKTAAKGGAQAQAYVCIDCGWIYDGSQGPFEKLPGSYRCPVCNSNKRRFAKTEAKGKAKAAPKGAAMRRGEADGEIDGGDKNFLAIAAVGGAAVLGALYVFLSSQVAP
ncbi:hypothetical protein Rsub_07985 [Raphidocelis subcapitata]|uniref:Rubredoxin-like domain-containing protein n=1 Tax=Raphidocelis subcapitata TaxID=307507 RepID=A0A2V0PA84_9CHLO|nr:hypothetical protein Rsub_07985 [Raphidocelis subcapitata]|eukprot:GBF94813.1 hypothetical protein Rsub_07985 [Raphidocelis subcapitata]